MMAAVPEPEAPVTPLATAGGAYSAWLISFKNAAEARSYLAAAQTKHPEIFTAARGAVSAASPGQGGTFHRVLVSGLASPAAARDLCQRLRAAEPGAFCKVLTN
jgi:cell division septation protein DedD